MSTNFVNIVGYQQEKVHTGMIAWLLDTGTTVRTSPLTLVQIVATVNKLVPGFLTEGEVDEVRATKELSFGRRCHIDLVIEFFSANKLKKALVIEVKTDSGVSTKQLEDSEREYLDLHKECIVQTVSLALGVGQFTIPTEQELDTYCMGNSIASCHFRFIDLQGAINVFTGLDLKEGKESYDQWIEALREEAKRVEDVFRYYRENGWEVFHEHGYRGARQIFYMMYDQVRKYLNQGEYRNWAIYGTSNNPVICWNEDYHRSMAKNPKKENGVIFWEFNYDSLCLKAKVFSLVWLSEIRNDVQKICTDCKVETVEGNTTKRTTGEWVTIYRWTFNFRRMSPKEIAEKTAEIISVVQPKIEAFQPK